MSELKIWQRAFQQQLFDSNNYKLNPEIRKKQRGIIFPLFILYDALRGCSDYVLKRLGLFITSHAEVSVPLVELALYRIYVEDLSKKSVVYSFGVSSNITFDQALTEECDCKIYLFDPTPPALDFIKSRRLGNSNLIFKPLGVWIETTMKRFYTDRSAIH